MTFNQKLRQRREAILKWRRETSPEQFIEMHQKIVFPKHPKGAKVEIVDLTVDHQNEKRHQRGIV